MPPLPRRHAARSAPLPTLLVTLVTLGVLAMADAPAPQLRPGRYVVEALEQAGLATLEGPGGEALVVTRAWLPVGAREGDVLVTLATQPSGDEAVRFELDAAATEARRRALQERRDGLPRAPEGDLEL